MGATISNRPKIEFKNIVDQRMYEMDEEDRKVIERNRLSTLRRRNREKHFEKNEWIGKQRKIIKIIKLIRALIIWSSITVGVLIICYK